MADIWTIHIDGASRGNPGPAAYAIVIDRPGMPVVEFAERLGETTNNIAEYTALVRALEKADDLGGQKLAIRSDSELLVKQMNGEYKVKSPELRALNEQAQALVAEFQNVSFTHVRREENRRADALCNQVLDAGKARANPAASRAKTPAKAASDLRVHDQVIECLRTAATAWARGNAENPPPEAVWEQLWSILEDARLVK